MQQAKKFALKAAIDLLLSLPRTACLGYEKKCSSGQFREDRAEQGRAGQCKASSSAGG